MLLPDINFWLALTFQSHGQQRLATEWMQSVPKNSCCFCRLTQIGFLRLATNRKVFGLDALQMQAAWGIYQQLLADPRVAYVEEPADLEVFWRSFTEREAYSPKVLNDSYLAAFAIAANFEIVTFDKGFTQYKNLRSKILG